MAKKRLFYSLSYSILQLWHNAYLADRVYRMVISKSRVHQFAEAFYWIWLIKSFLKLKGTKRKLRLALVPALNDITTTLDEAKWKVRTCHCNKPFWLSTRIICPNYCIFSWNKFIENNPKSIDIDFRRDIAVLSISAPMKCKVLIINR